MRIGPYVFDALPLVLAPMAAVSELPFRRICLELGADLAPTELLSAEGLWRLQARTLAYLRHDPACERPFVVQIFGARPESMAKAAEVALERGAGIVDINMGCPVSKVTKNGAGAALMNDPERAVAIVEAVRRALPESIPVTAKIRSGWDSASLNVASFAERIEQAGVAAIAVHGRTRAQAYSGTADWGAIAAVKRAVRVPVIGNGDVLCREDALRMVAETGCDAVMIGRGAMGNPWIFRECKGGPAPDRSERGVIVRRHLLEHVGHFGREEVKAVHAFRAQLACYARGLSGAAEFRREVMRIDDVASLLGAIDAFFGA